MVLQAAVAVAAARGTKQEQCLGAMELLRKGQREGMEYGFQRQLQAGRRGVAAVPERLAVPRQRVVWVAVERALLLEFPEP